MSLQSILRQLYPLPRFVYGKAKMVKSRGKPKLCIELRPRRGAKPLCGKCMKPGPGYDSLGHREFDFVPFWGIVVTFIYQMRRVDCRRCGVTVEEVPWASGKSPATYHLAWFLADWAKVLSWKETAKRFHSSWTTVFRCVEFAVQWGLRHRVLDGIQSIGVDELSWKKGQKYLTMVYQIDHGCRRLLWIGRDRTAATFNGFFDMLGEARSGGIKFVASDMWRAFLGVIARRATGALHVLDRFHVAQLLSKAVDNVRREEVRKLRAVGKKHLLKDTRWILLKHPENLKESQRGRLADLVRLNLRTVRAYLLKDHLRAFWGYVSPYWAGRFLDAWIRRARRSRLAPFVTFAATLREHRELLLNWFRARHAFAHGAVEGFNNKARISTRKAYGFRNPDHVEIALYHALGNLPEPDFLAHRFL